MCCGFTMMYYTCTEALRSTSAYLVLLLFTSSDGRGVRQSFTYTLHTTAMSWNEALSVCEASGSTLFTPMTLQKYYDFKQIYEYWSNGGEYMGELWMGLYNDNPSNSEFTWTNCCAAEPLWALWSWDEPNFLDMERCVRLYWGDEWKTKSCDVSFPFVCETKTDGCNFEIIENASLQSSSDIIYVESVSLAQCENYCLHLHKNNEECVAFTYTNTNTCMIEKGVQVYITALPATSVNPGDTTSVKRCYQYLIQRRSSAISNYEIIPNHNCAERATCDNPLFLPSPPESSTVQVSTFHLDSSSTDQSDIPTQSTITEISVPLSYLDTAPCTKSAVSTLSVTALYSSSGEPTKFSMYQSESEFSDLERKPSTGALVRQVETFADVTSTSDLFTAQPPSHRNTMILASSTATDVKQTPSTSVTHISSTSGTQAPSTSVTQISSTSVKQNPSTSVTQTPSRAASVPTNSTVAGNTSPAPAMCPCLCFPKGTKSHQVYFSHLRMNRRELSSFRRSHTSADDPRLSARAMGSVLGMGILLSVGLLIVVLDINVIIKLFGKSDTKKTT